MLFESIIATILGLCAGTFTGLIPGVHINLIGAILASSTPILITYLSPVSLAVFLFSTAITHTFVDAIPSTLLGVPNPDTVEMILPAHKMVLEGRGYEAVRLATMGAHVGMIIGIMLMPVLIFILPMIYEPISPYVGWLLLAVSAYFIITEEDNNKRFWAAMIFLFSGCLGSFVLTFPNLDQPLLPMLSGLFGISTLLISIMDDKISATQKTEQEKGFSFISWSRTIFTAITAGWIASMLPGLGTAQATMVAKASLPKDPRLFLVAAGGINTLNYLFSLATWISLDKARNGAVVVIKDLIPSSKETMIILIASSIIVAGAATLITLVLARLAIKLIDVIDYTKIAWSIIIFLTILTTLLSGILGLFIMILATAIGILTQLVGIRKSAAMGCLVIPVIIFFIG